MAPTYLPRVGVFPIVGEKSIVTLLGTGLSIPASVQDDCPLIGKMAPEISLLDHLGRRCSLHATIALGRPIILFFFPLAGSPHCTKESCLFRDALGLTPIFSDLQAIVIGISQDPPTRSKRFVDEHHLGYRILHDNNREAMNTYGVPRAMMGMVDQRCTFIIDPSGTVRAMVQGVLDADGHVAFAEKWLIRLEHELSQRSKKVIAYEKDQNRELMTDLSSSDSNGWTRVTYGEEDSASIGGIDAAPRHGAASFVSGGKQGTQTTMYAVPNYSRRLINAPYLAKEATTKPVEPVGEAATHDESFVQSDTATSKASSTTMKEKNIWRHWKSVFKELSSADDKPPPMVLSRDWTKSDNQHSSASRRSISGSSTNANNGLPRSKSQSRLKSKTSLRRGSVSSIPTREANASKDTFGQSVFSDSANDVPAVPPLFATMEAATVAAQQQHQPQQATTPQSVQSGRMPRTSMIDSESSDRDASSSMSSNVSTAATSLMGTSSHGSLRYTNSNGTVNTIIPLANGVKQYQLAKPAVTSEVLMPGEVLDFHQGDLPTVIKPVNSSLQYSALSTDPIMATTASVKSTSTPATPNPARRLSVTRKPAPVQQEIVHDPIGIMGESPNRPNPSVTPTKPVRTSSRTNVRPSTSSSSSLTAPFEPPQDVPQDEGLPDEEEFVSQSGDGRIQVLDRSSSLQQKRAVEQIRSGHNSLTNSPNHHQQQYNHVRNPSIGSNGGGDLSGFSTPKMRLTDEEMGQFGSNGNSNSPRLSQQKQPSLREIRAQRHRSTSINDGIYRMHTPTLADAVATEVNLDQDQDGISSLSPRPRSARTMENGLNGGGNQQSSTTTRLRRPIAPPLKDHVYPITRQLSKSSISDASDTNVLSTSPASSDHHQLYYHQQQANSPSKVVRKSNVRTDHPSVITAASIGDVPPRPAPPIPTATAVNGSSTKIKNSPANIFFDASSDFFPADDIRRPSVSSMGTFGRRGSDLVE